MKIKKKTILLSVGLMFLLGIVYLKGMSDSSYALAHREYFSQGVLATYDLTKLEKIKSCDKSEQLGSLQYRLELAVDGAIYEYHILKNQNTLKYNLDNMLFGNPPLERGLDALVSYRKKHPSVYNSSWVDQMPNANQDWYKKKKKTSDHMVNTIKKTIELYQ